MLYQFCNNQWSIINDIRLVCPISKQGGTHSFIHLTILKRFMRGSEKKMVIIFISIEKWTLKIHFINSTIIIDQSIINENKLVCLISEQGGTDSFNHLTIHEWKNWIPSFYVFSQANWGPHCQNVFLLISVNTLFLTVNCRIDVWKCIFNVHFAIDVKMMTILFLLTFMNHLWIVRWMKESVPPCLLIGQTSLLSLMIDHWLL